MTIRELFELAESLGVADRPLGVSYDASDGWYSWEGDTSADVELDTDGNTLVLVLL